MAGRGPAPRKDRSERVRPGRDVPASTTVSADGELRGPDLPEDRQWPAQTVKWWTTWRVSAQSQALTDTDWDFLLDTALLHAEFWNGDSKVAAELRLRVAKFGATPEDRARLRLQITEPEPKPGQAAAQPGGRYAHLRSLPTG